MPDVRRCKSIAEASTFQQAISEYADAEIWRASMNPTSVVEEASLRVRLADAAVDASYAALIAVIDHYCAVKLADSIDRARLVDVSLLQQASHKPGRKDK